MRRTHDTIEAAILSTVEPRPVPRRARWSRQSTQPIPAALLAALAQVSCQVCEVAR